MNLVRWSDLFRWSRLIRGSRLIRCSGLICWSGLIRWSGLTCWSIAGLVLFQSGCSKQPPDVVSFEPNLVHTAKYEVAQNIPMDQASKDAYWIVDRMFGTPDAPTLPPCILDDDDLAGVVSLENLDRASGAAGSPSRGLFAQHCVKCHGITGNGRGVIAAVQTPYPRDFRMGVFKFKQTPSGVKPTKADIARLIKHGIGGTAMNPIPELTDSDIGALVDYVVYLSMRGEVERQCVDGAMFDGIIEDGDRILNTELASQLDADPTLAEQLETAADDEQVSDEMEARIEAYELFQENWQYAQDYAIEIAESWLESDDERIPAEEPPADILVARSAADVAAIRAGPNAAALNESIHRGRLLFTGKIASCSKCHGEKGLGDGQVTDYDDWTKDWTVRMKLDPMNREALIPLLARGAMEPRNIVPRNFSEGIFRGGKSSAQLYRRIKQGIDGTPMPAATFVEGEFEESDVWHIINYIRSLEQLDS